MYTQKSILGFIKTDIIFFFILLSSVVLSKVVLVLANNTNFIGFFLCIYI